MLCLECPLGALLYRHKLCLIHCKQDVASFYLSFAFVFFIALLVKCALPYILDRTQELVALTGAHTLGSKGFGNPTVFDNSYYKILLEKPWMSSGYSAYILFLMFF